MTTDRIVERALQIVSVQALADIFSQHPELPPAYITVNKPWHGSPSSLDFQLETPTDFELWRIALGVDPKFVSLHPSGRASWIEASTVRDGIRMSISAHGILLTLDQLDAPRDLSEVPA
ncbi:MAG: hypothetical protein ACJ768_08080 [Gaiellaceae bacterium]